MDFGPGLKPELKHQSAEWRFAGSSMKLKVRQNPSSVKLMVIVAYDVRGVIVCHFIPHCNNPARQCQDHINQCVRQLLRRWGWEELEHPPYSPDILPCDFDLIPTIKEPIRGRWFATREDIANSVRQQVTRCTHGSANADGKMFKCVDLSKLITFFIIFHNDKPVDWLLDHVVQTKVCRFDKDPKDCKKRKDQVWLHFKPSLFQHVGTHSSLKGKVQKLKDKQFGKLSLHHPHKNPDADVKTSLKAYKGYSAVRAYKGDTFFWSLLPQPGDILAFHFHNPIIVERYLHWMQSGLLFCTDDNQ
ncbi:alpha-1,3-mannosyl-glycoprotein 4-beta-N-acetylglucosaminyltransferase B [Trichonephila clavipes]|nr:alpha-1,3-mannosyl-glycoprotein 4-beta-N-acetylglucosaminyltransferase B [Trichonephila clavipes]